MKKIKNPPAVLYAVGNLELLNKDCIAIVGTRNITEYGINNCKYFAKKLTQNGIPIISGMALGTDTVAHKTVIQYGGETIAVLGSGFNNVFPKENLGLFEKIIENNGLVITEYPENIVAKSKNFLQRNRIVSGLSEGVLVIESAYRSGTSVTAKLAYSQGKKVMALPGRLDSSYGVGVNKLIQNGAKLITDVEDILEEFPQFDNKMWKTDVAKQENIFNIYIENNEYAEVMRVLQGKTLSVEEIYNQLPNKTLREVLNLLTNMELENYIVQELGEGYRISEKI